MVAGSIPDEVIRFFNLPKSVVGIATRYELDDLGVEVRVPVGPRIFPSPRLPDRVWGPPNLLSNGYGGFFPGLKLPGRAADHSPPASAG
jgi:hypothetical protein